MVREPAGLFPRPGRRGGGCSSVLGQAPLPREGVGVRAPASPAQRWVWCCLAGPRAPTLVTQTVETLACVDNAIMSQKSVSQTEPVSGGPTPLAEGAWPRLELQPPPPRAPLWPGGGGQQVLPGQVALPCHACCCRKIPSRRAEHTRLPHDLSRQQAHEDVSHTRGADKGFLVPGLQCHAAWEKSPGLSAWKSPRWPPFPAPPGHSPRPAGYSGQRCSLWIGPSRWGGEEQEGANAVGRCASPQHLQEPRLPLLLSSQEPPTCQGHHLCTPGWQHLQQPSGNRPFWEAQSAGGFHAAFLASPVGEQPGPETQPLASPRTHMASPGLQHHGGGARGQPAQGNALRGRRYYWPTL